MYLYVQTSFHYALVVLTKFESPTLNLDLSLEGVRKPQIRV